MLKLLFIGDIVGRPGRDIVAARGPKTSDRTRPGFCHRQWGKRRRQAPASPAPWPSPFSTSGVDALTLGDHVWDQRGWETEITQIERVCRPANLPAACPGWDHLIIEARGFRLAVFTVLGRQFMGMKADCPFLCADRMIDAAEGPGRRDHRGDSCRGHLGEAGHGLAPRRPGDRRPGHPHARARRRMRRPAQGHRLYLRRRA